MAAVLLTGCETTSSIPYKASTENVIAIQQTLQSKKVSVADIDLAPGVDQSLLCRLNGPINVAPCKTIPQYIKEAFQEELFMAQAYDVKGPAIQGRIEELSFSSVSPASWTIKMFVKSATSPGYEVSVTCGQCPGEHPIQGRGTDMDEDGRASVLNGDQVLCPCAANHVKASPDAGCSA